MNPIILIPSRLASTRLPNKPLADIHGKPMIVHVLERAQEANVGRVVVACGDEEIKIAVEAAGGDAVMTDPDLPTGSDRIMQALERVDPNGEHDVIVNVQGDLPTIDPAIIQEAYKLLENPETDIGTLAAIITTEEECQSPNVVKAITEIDTAKGERIGRALYFSRTTAPSGEGDLLHHIGLYAYRRDALKKFVASSPAYLEQREKLEQLRALALGMRIDVAVVDDVPLGLDTEEDLIKARKVLA